MVLPALRTIAAAMLAALSGAAWSSPFEVSSPNVDGRHELKLEYKLENASTGSREQRPKLAIKVPASADLEFGIKESWRRAHDDGEPAHQGWGDVELSAKWTLLRENAASRRIGIAVEPELKLPTGDARRHLGAETTQLRLPLIVGRRLGRYGLYSEFGYAHRFGTDDDTLSGGQLLMVACSHTLKLGAEIVATAPRHATGRYAVATDIGAKWSPDPALELQGLIGRSLHTPDDSAVTTLKLAAEWKY